MKNNKKSLTVYLERKIARYPLIQSAWDIYKCQARDFRLFCEVLRPELKELIGQAFVFEGKNRVPHPLLQSPHPVLLRRLRCSLLLLSSQHRAKLRGQSVCKFPSSFPLSLFLCLPHPRIYHTLVLSLTPSARDS